MTTENNNTQNGGKETKHIVAAELRNNLAAVAVIDMGPVTKHYVGLRDGEFAEILPDSERATKKAKFGLCKAIDIAEKRGADISVTAQEYLESQTQRHIAQAVAPVRQELDENSISGERRQAPEQKDTVEKQVEKEVGNEEEVLEVASAAAETSDDRDDGYERVPWDDYGSDGSDLESPAEPEVRDDIGSDE